MCLLDSCGRKIFSSREFFFFHSIIETRDLRGFIKDVASCWRMYFKNGSEEIFNDFRRWVEGYWTLIWRLEKLWRNKLIHQGIVPLTINHLQSLLQVERSDWCRQLILSIIVSSYNNSWFWFQWYVVGKSWNLFFYRNKLFVKINNNDLYFSCT